MVWLKGKRAFKEMVNYMLSYSGLSDGFWGEAMLKACYLLNRVPNKRNKTTPYEIWFYVIEHNDSVSINSIIESRDAIFNENRFPSLPRPKDIIPNSDESQRDDHSDYVPSKIPEPESIKEYPRTYNEAIESRNIAFWKEEIHDEIGSIMGNDMWALSDLPPDCKPLGIDNVTVTIFLLDLKPSVPLRGYKIEKNALDGCSGIEKEGRFQRRKAMGRYRLFYVIEHNDSVSINSIIESRDAIFDENRFPSLPRPKDIIPNSDESQRDDHSDYVPSKIPEPRKEYPRTYNEAMQSRDIAFWKEEIHDEIGFIMGNDMLALSDLPPDCKPLGIDKTYQNQVDKTKKFLSSRFSMRDMGEADIILDSSSTSGWVFLLGGGAISWASNKQTCITGSIMESEFVALAAAGKEAEWLRNMIYEIPIWPKLIAPISIRCDSAPTMAKAYSQVYNEKSRHLGVRYSVIKTFIMKM
uniref:Zinc finger, CCHC-type n=1 Tax=Tanacetum cinerariifolium TaxID=118510 RepID=A0A6L2LT07_TANCI|nr:zinc finger, CCHC-type [Tanacetum cinerariifolium]